ncbi:MAG: radical SAM protein [Candidatus Pacebacteria bacterium]|nr:radical SAM protein [Candidatus Paceibacterota bacterium]MDD3729089.1 radical SAM protein [Candidatus Paceibacterota bacterium]MDD5445924.1 radical SAM protein [Candidatus Paceibacterota bacterium]
MPLREIHWEVTNRCKLRCKHCLPMSGPPRPGELTTEEAMAALDSFKGAGASKVFFTGGEPFSRRDFTDLLERTVALGMRASVITNATYLRGEILGLLKRLEVKLGISLDGANEATNDAIRGKGNFKQAIEALKRCQENDIAVTLYVTVTVANIGQLDTFARLTKEYSCNGIHFNEVAIAGRAIGFSDELALSDDQKRRLPELVAQATQDVFGEKLSETDDLCWVDAETLYMTAEGKLYVCSEVFQRRLDLAIGNIRSFPLKEWLERNTSAYSGHGNKCCYGVRASEHVVFVGNVAPECPFAPRKQGIETLSQLYDALDELYQGIEQDCRDCQDPDCMGYIWLLKKEAERLYERGVPLVQVNNGPTFIHSFPATVNGKPNLSVRYPPCSQLCSDSRRCSIYEDRPLVCRLYPLGLETKEDGTIVWALHRDCLHIRRMEERGTLPAFENRVRNIISNLSPELLEEIVETYRAVDAVSSFPDGENNYSSLQEVRYVQVQGHPGR